jgi:hypothetical protein
MTGLAGGAGGVEQLPRNEMGKVLREEPVHLAEEGA